MRKKLAVAGAAKYVVNVWGVGYRLLGDEFKLRRSA